MVFFYKIIKLMFVTKVPGLINCPENFTTSVVWNKTGHDQETHGTVDGTGTMIMPREGG